MVAKTVNNQLVYGPKHHQTATFIYSRHLQYLVNILKSISDISDIL